VVTGKLDVREAAARLPDEAPPDVTETPQRESLENRRGTGCTQSRNDRS
jgi:hypothetical protein